MTPPNLLTVYVARPLRQNLLIDFEYILQIQRKDIFLLRCLEFVREERLSFPGQNIFYSMRCDNVAIPLEIIFVDSVKHCGKRSNLSLVHFMCSTFVYYFVNHAMVVVLSHIVSDKFIHVRHNKAEIGCCDSSLLQVSVGFRSS